MTNFPSCFTTEGLKVPADSNLSPCGTRMGSAESRVQVPKGGEKETAAAAANAMPRNAAMAEDLAARIAEKRILIIMKLPSLACRPGKYFHEPEGAYNRLILMAS